MAWPVKRPVGIDTPVPRIDRWFAEGEQRHDDKQRSVPGSAGVQTVMRRYSLAIIDSSPGSEALTGRESQSVRYLPPPVVCAVRSSSVSAQTAAPSDALQASAYSV
jgi:hypothetical protein